MFYILSYVYYLVNCSWYNVQGQDQIVLALRIRLQVVTCSLLNHRLFVDYFLENTFLHTFQTQPFPMDQMKGNIASICFRMDTFTFCAATWKLCTQAARPQRSFTERMDPGSHVGVFFSLQIYLKLIGKLLDLHRLNESHVKVKT